MHHLGGTHLKDNNEGVAYYENERFSDHDISAQLNNESIIVMLNDNPIDKKLCDSS